MKDRIIVIDDDNKYLGMAMSILSEEYDCFLAQSYSDILYVSEIAGKPSLFLVDIFFEGAVRYDIIEKLLNNPDFKNVPIIITTESYDYKTQEECFSKGVFDFVLKPFNSKIFKARVSRALKMFHLQENLQKEVDKQTAEVVAQKERSESLFAHVVDALICTIEAKDYYTKGHSLRVSKYSEILALEIGVDEKDAKEIARAGALHDIGKISVPLSILNSPTKLSTSEYEKVKAHTVSGWAILSAINELGVAKDVARHHHEWYNGNGYPDKLSGNDISIPAKIVAIADAFDVISKGRRYQGKKTDLAAADEIERCAGTQFDPQIAEVFVRLVREGRICSGED